MKKGTDQFFSSFAEQNHGVQEPHCTSSHCCGLYRHDLSQRPVARALLVILYLI